MSKMDRRILREMIRRRVARAVDLCELALLHTDLALAVGEAVQHAGRRPEDALGIVQSYLHDAWADVGELVIPHEPIFYGSRGSPGTTGAGGEEGSSMSPRPGT